MKEKSIRTIFICANIINNELVMDSITAMSNQEAGNEFFNRYKIHPMKILGPFIKRKKFEKSTNINIEKIKFLNKTKKAIYKDWLVNAFLLKEPENHALLIFINHIDQLNKCKPNKTIVSIKELRFLDE